MSDYVPGCDIVTNFSLNLYLSRNVYIIVFLLLFVYGMAQIVAKGRIFLLAFLTHTYG